MARRLFALTVVVLTVCGASSAAACPDCETALTARERFANEQLGERIAISILPFALTSGAAFAIGRLVDRRRRA